MIRFRNPDKQFIAIPSSRRDLFTVVRKSRLSMRVVQQVRCIRACSSVKSGSRFRDFFPVARTDVMQIFTSLCIGKSELRVISQALRFHVRTFTVPNDRRRCAHGYNGSSFVSVDMETRVRHSVQIPFHSLDSLSSWIRKCFTEIGIYSWVYTVWRNYSEDRSNRVVEIPNRKTEIDRASFCW